VLYGIVIFPMLANSTQWQDLPAQNEPGSSICRFYDNSKKGYPQFQKNCRSVEYTADSTFMKDTRLSIYPRRRRDTHAAGPFYSIDLEYAVSQADGNLRQTENQSI
jgi:hypothetical protein